MDIFFKEIIKLYIRLISVGLGLNKSCLQSEAKTSESLKFSHKQKRKQDHVETYITPPYF